MPAAYRLAQIHLVTIVVLLLASIVGGAEPVDFFRDIQPILSERCLACHGAKNVIEGGLNLTKPQSAFLRADSGELAIIPKHSEDSELWRRVNSADDELRMPPEGEPLSPEQRVLIRSWIDEGAHWPPSTQRTHWAYVVPKLAELPDDTSGWSHHPVDQFVLAKMKEHELSPSPEAEPARLLRRLHLDLVGLPPSVDEVNRYLANPSDQRYEAEVERLLASPQYGEKWSRHWLDLARYSDSNGYQADQIREMWAFRDWVIDAMNDDMPYDQFTVEQIAGDLLPNATLSQQIATGFHRATTCNVEAGVDPEGNRTDQVIDRVNTTGTTWLATTLECAQCHNHKFDPISQQEYYELFAFFNNTPVEVKQEKKDSVQFNFYGPKLALPPQSQKQQQRRAELQAELDQLSAKIHAIESQKDPDQTKLKLLKTLQQQKSDTTAKLKSVEPRTTLVMQEMKAKRETTMFVRGNFLTPGPKVKPAVPRALNEFPESLPRDRRGLATWLIDPANPLTARVAVNRWWYEIFGRGIVDTVADFGTQGSLPTHPELLDWLAIQLQTNDWSMKAIHRMIVTSATYRQSSRVTPRHLVVDPDNRWLARGPRNRLPAELIRDNALSVSGLLMDAMHGPPVYPPQPDGLWRQTGRNEPVFKPAENADRFRRGIYVVWRRAAPYPTFVTFDAPDRMTCVACRPETNTPLQALALLNDEAFAEAAKAMAVRVMNETAGRDVTSQLEYAVKLALARAPTRREIEVLLQLLEAELENSRKNDQRVADLLDGSAKLNMAIPDDTARWAAWFCVCNALLNLDEAISK